MNSIKKGPEPALGHVPLASFVRDLEAADEKVHRDLKPYQDLGLRRALKKRTGLGSQQLAVPWAELVRRAAEPVHVVPIAHLGPEFCAGLVLKETEDFRAGRAVAGRLLTKLEEAHWKGWGNPFMTELTAQTCAELGIPDYLKIISNPMSLPQMRRKFDTQPSFGLVALKEDFNLMVANAKEFNPPADEMHRIALSIEEQFKGFLKAEREQVAAAVEPPKAKKTKK